MKIRSDKNEEWKNDSENSSDGKIISKGLDPTQTPRTQTAKKEIKITFHRPRQRQNNGSPINLRKLLRLGLKRNQYHEGKS
jgi:hypothetical protein